MLVVDVVIVVARWLAETPAEIARSDFVQMDTAGTLVRTGLGTRLYDPAAQTAVYGQLIHHQYQGILLFNHSPITAILLALPSYLPLDAAFRVWGALQLLLLIAVAVFVARATAPRTDWMLLGAAAALIGITVPSTLPMLLEAQGLGLAAFLLGIGFLAWRRGNEFGAGILIAAAAWSGKPHLFIGIAIFMLFTGHRRLIAGAAAGTIATVLVSVVLLGPQTTFDFPLTMVRSIPLYGINGFYGYGGVFSSDFGSGTPAYVLTVIAALTAVSVCAFCGLRFRQKVFTLLPAIIVVTALSLALTPHLYAHDLTLLAPLFVAWAAATFAGASRPLSTTTISAWLLLSLAVAVDYSQPQTIVLGRLTPWALTILAAMAWHSRVPLSYPARHAVAGGGVRL